MDIRQDLMGVLLVLLMMILFVINAWNLIPNKLCSYKEKPPYRTSLIEKMYTMNVERTIESKEILGECRKIHYYNEVMYNVGMAIDSTLYMESLLRDSSCIKSI